MGNLTISWIDPDGATTNLMDGTNYDVLVGKIGDYLPGYMYSDDPLPGQPGALLRDYEIESRFIDLPMLIRDSSNINNRMRSLFSKVRPKKDSDGNPRQGRLRFAEAGGNTRDLYCIYASGLEGNDKLALRGKDWYRAVISFKAVDPFFYATSEVSYTFTAETPGLFLPIPPIRLTNAAVYSEETVTNNGEEETWPVWTIVGPGDEIKLENLTSGKSFEMKTTFSLGDGEELIIDTRPGAKTIVDQFGNNLFQYFKKGTEFWPLIEGGNQISIQMNNSNANSEVNLVYTPRYLTW